jgi:hypothetical protein
MYMVDLPKPYGHMLLVHNYNVHVRARTQLPGIQSYG